MNHNRQIYRNRRVALLRHMRATTGGGLALVPTAPELARIRFFPTGTTAISTTCPDSSNPKR
jgi:hypothetical protein